ncbi:MAG: preprotein translocase subunit SecA [Chloroflexi bacterium]|nr:preprotein translocase subunit SecA [Chloroflexota bacterium]MBE3115374.1 preprotein translocase subunit SecA [Actinomycetota bacterium]
MFKNIGNILKFGEGKKIKKYEEIVSAVSNLEKDISSLTDSQLAAKSIDFKQRYENGQKLEDLMPEVFAVVREVAKRTLNMRHFDVQILGGVVLFEGKIAEMKTGEGKTLVATLPVYLNSFTGRSTHLVTVNDYLAKRDSEWMGNIYKFLGLKVGLIQHEMSTLEKKEQYRSDVIYGTNNEFGFDYLRDNMIMAKENIVQDGHWYVIIDEVDSILIDEARTPLIISGVAYGTTEIYSKFTQIVPRLEIDVDFEIDEKARTAAITEEGVEKVERILGIENLYDPSNFLYIHALNQSLKAYHLFKRDVDYMLKNGEIIIVDEFTGRLMPGRRYSEGLHQAIEAKERVKVRDENQTLATITIQNYFRMYEKLAGMTGTALTEAAEFRHIYGLETVVIPTNEPMIRKDLPDLIYKNEQIKFDNAVEDIVSRYNRGQPILVGTISIEKSERLSNMLKRRGIPHEVLNAKYHEKEAQIIAKAGQKNSVTIATNMAGRGTDIVLGEGVVELGGLHVFGTERHESRRIDNQLRGRSGRQGDIGSSQFYLSTEDDLLRLFGSERIYRVMETFNFPDDLPIQHPIISRAIENAQRQVEGRNFEIRKHVLEYDDVMNKQREVIYGRRKKILEEENLRSVACDMIKDIIDRSVDIHINPGDYPENWDLETLSNYITPLFSRNIITDIIDRKKIGESKWDISILKEKLAERAYRIYEERENSYSPPVIRKLEKIVMLNVIDNMWRGHLLEMDYLQEGIGLRAIGQRDPLVEYKRETFNLFKELIEEIKFDTVRLLYNVRIVTREEQEKQKTVRENEVTNIVTSGPLEAGSIALQTKPVTAKKIGRNDPCLCGSGKKYKKCCGR